MMEGQVGMMHEADVRSKWHLPNSLITSGRTPNLPTADTVGLFPGGFTWDQKNAARKIIYRHG